VRFGKARHGLRLGDSPHRDPTQRRLVLNSRRRILDPSRWISEPYHNDGCRERWFALVPMFAALRKSASGPSRRFHNSAQVRWWSNRTYWRDHG
jgi:hypothetical protein